VCQRIDEYRGPMAGADVALPKRESWEGFGHDLIDFPVQL
jgi:hypothetical protein